MTGQDGFPSALYVPSETANFTNAQFEKIEARLLAWSTGATGFWLQEPGEISPEVLKKLWRDLHPDVVAYWNKMQSSIGFQTRER